ncbi:nucleoside/nucleotide kinase family protein [Dermatophilaceae bacterium Soc4.6]
MPSPGVPTPPTSPLAEAVLAPLLDRAAELVDDAQGQRPVVLGVTGSPGAGKTTLAEALVAALVAGGPARPPLVVSHLPMDGFHLADVQLARLGLADRKGAPETFDVDGYLAVLQRVRSGAGRPVYAPGFERDLEQPIAAAVVVEPSVRLVVTEGNYLLLDDPAWRAVRGAMDQVWYVDLDEDERLRRLVERHVAFGKEADEARAWALGPDQANARRVVATRDAADLVVTLG